jgi:hypothetical protein
MPSPGTQHRTPSRASTRNARAAAPGGSGGSSSRLATGETLLPTLTAPSAIRSSRAFATWTQARVAVPPRPVMVMLRDSRSRV